MAIYACDKCGREFIRFRSKYVQDERIKCPDCKAKEIINEGLEQFNELDLESLCIITREVKDACK